MIFTILSGKLKTKLNADRYISLARLSVFVLKLSRDEQLDLLASHFWVNLERVFLTFCYFGGKLLFELWLRLSFAEIICTFVIYGGIVQSPKRAD